MCCFYAGVRLPQLAPRTQRLEHGTTQAPVKNERYENVEIVLPEGGRCCRARGHYPAALLFDWGLATHKEGWRQDDDLSRGNNSCLAAIRMHNVRHCCVAQSLLVVALCPAPLFARVAPGMEGAHQHADHGEPY